MVEVGNLIPMGTIRTDDWNTALYFRNCIQNDFAGSKKCHFMNNHEIRGHFSVTLKSLLENCWVCRSEFNSVEHLSDPKTRVTSIIASANLYSSRKFEYRI